MDGLYTIYFIFREFIYPLIVATAVIWAPLLVIWVLREWWLEYVRKETILKAQWTMIEIKIPKEIYKSPAAIETILTSLHGETKYPLFSPGIDTKWSTLITDFGKWYGALWKGSWPLWWSLEIASIEGNIYFFIRCEPKNKEGIENLIYSQFPQAEVTEVDDYTRYVPPFKAGGDWDLRGCEYKLKNNDALPIKTYVDYGLHDSFNLEEEQKIDPVVPLLQVLGSLGVGEQAWIQFVIQGSWARFENPDKEKAGEKPFVTWQDLGKHYLENEILKRWQKPLTTEKKKDEAGNTTDTPKTMTSGYGELPPVEKEKAEAINRNLLKPGYDCGIRVVYIGKKPHFKSGKLGEIKNAFKQFNSPNLNSFDAHTGTDDGFDYPWQDYQDLKKFNNREKMFKRYVKREFFYPPEMGATVAVKKALDKPLVSGTLKKPELCVLNTEELATIFHFPGTVAQTSGLGRIDAQKAEPPANLPF
jgi:hypothetical protein